jgi:hypothetical protein
VDDAVLVGNLVRRVHGGRVRQLGKTRRPFSFLRLFRSPTGRGIRTDSNSENGKPPPLPCSPPDRCRLYAMTYREAHHAPRPDGRYAGVCPNRARNPAHYTFIHPHQPTPANTQKARQLVESPGLSSHSLRLLRRLPFSQFFSRFALGNRCSILLSYGGVERILA